MRTNVTLFDQQAIRPGRCGAVVRLLALAASLVLAAAGFAAEPLPTGQTGQRGAPPLPPRTDPGATPSPAHERTLRDVVTALEDTHGIRIWLDGAVPGTTPSAVDPTGLPAEVALRQAFTGYDLFLHYRPNPDTGALEVARAWVVPRGRGDRLQVLAGPATAAPGQGNDETARGALALHGLSLPPGIDPRDALWDALANPDESVRQDALLAAQAAGMPLPRVAIEGLALRDASEAVRLVALDLLTTTPEIDAGTARAMLEQAALDPSPVIQEHAAGLLSALNAHGVGTVPGSGGVPELDTVLRALEDRDATVRQQALETALSYGLAVTPENIERILKYDASDGVRVTALNALVLTPEVDPERRRAVLEWAARDANPLVRDQAAALLDALHPPTDMPEEPAPSEAPPPALNEAPPDTPAGDGSAEAESPAQ